MSKGTGAVLLAWVLLSALAMPYAISGVPGPAVPGAAHPPIRINSDVDFPGVASAGNGTGENPWVIENLDIDANGTGPCLFIGNTTQHFIVRNCTMHNASGQTFFPHGLGGGIVLSNASGGMLLNNTLVNSSYGMVIYDSGWINITLNNASGNTDNGIHVSSSGNITIHGNMLAGNNIALNLSNIAWNVQVFNNTIMDSSMGLLASMPISGVILYHNNFINNTVHLADDGAVHWDAGYPTGGNYWDTYNGTDANADGFGDAPMVLDADSDDRYPLMEPYSGQQLGDVVPPRAVIWSPDGDNVSPQASISITWNETMDWASVEDAFSYSNGVENFTSANGTWVHDTATNTSTFTPASALAYDTTYYVTVNCTAADLAGNMLDQDGSGTGGEWPADVLTWNFTVHDPPPWVMSTVPADGQINVDPATGIQITFSETMNMTSVEDAFSYTNGTLIWDTGNGTEGWNADGTVFSFQPVPPLEMNQTYTVTVNSSMARDAGGRIMGADYSWHFTTWAEPPPPRVVNTYPPGGTTNVPVSTYINLAFDMAMDMQSVEDAFSYTDGSAIWNSDSGTIDWFSGGTLFSFQPAERLGFDTTYTVRINSSAMSTYGTYLDGNQNGISEPDDDFVFTFTTGPEPPTVLSHYPGPDQSGVPVDLGAIYINFSKPMDTVSVTNGISIYPTVDVMPSFSSDQRNLTLLLNHDLAEATQYRVTVASTAVDTTGLRLDGNGDGAGGDRFSFSFSTEGLATLEPPFILYVYPRPNSTIPAEQFTMSITFSQDMNMSSVEQAFSFSNSSGQINGTFRWATAKTVWFMPDVALEPNTTYTATLLSTARDEHGLYLENTTSWQYTTEPDTPPTSIKDLVLYGLIVALLLLCLVLYMANRSLRRDLRRTRVKLKRLGREYRKVTGRLPPDGKGADGEKQAEGDVERGEASAPDEDGQPALNEQAAEDPADGPEKP